MVRIRTGALHDMYGGECVAGKCTEKFLKKLSIHFAKHWPRELNSPAQMCPARQINDGVHECLVHGHTCLPKSGYTPFFSNCFGKSLTEDDADILNRMMRIDMKVAFGAYLEIKKSMAAKGGQHMIKKADPCGYLGFSGPIQVDLQ